MERGVISSLAIVAVAAGLTVVLKGHGNFIVRIRGSGTKMTAPAVHEFDVRNDGERCTLNIKFLFVLGYTLPKSPTERNS